MHDVAYESPPEHVYDIRHRFSSYGTICVVFILPHPRWNTGTGSLRDLPPARKIKKARASC